MNGDDRFGSAALATLSSACRTGGCVSQPTVIAPVDCAPNSGLASIFDCQNAAGPWRLFVSDTPLDTIAGQFVSTTDWR